MRVTAIHGVDQEKLASVVAEMITLGAPTIRIVNSCNGWLAIEGTHRLAAASKLGLEPNFIELADDELVDGETIDIDVGNDMSDNEVDGSYPAWTLVEQIGGGATYKIG